MKAPFPWNPRRKLVYITGGKHPCDTPGFAPNLHNTVENMSQRNHRWIALLSILLLAIPLAAGATKYTADFMTKGTGARPLAMGGAFTAVGDDTNVLFFNPGALAALEGRSLSLMHAERFGGLVQVDHGGFHLTRDFYGREASIGLSVLRVGVDDIWFTGDHPYNDLNENGEFDGPEELPTTIDPSYLRKVSDQEWAVLGVYATQVRRWSLGGALKVIYQSVGEYNSFGFGLDAGVLSPPLPGGLRAGLKIQDITGTYVAWSTGVSEFVAPSLRPGIAWRQDLPEIRASVLIALDLETRFENYQEAAAFHAGRISVDPHLGLEIWLLQAVALRMGVDGENWTAGGGLKLAGQGGILPWDSLKALCLDYGFGNHEDLDGSHRVGLGLSF